MAPKEGAALEGKRFSQPAGVSLGGRRAGTGTYFLYVRIPSIRPTTQGGYAVENVVSAKPKTLRLSGSVIPHVPVRQWVLSLRIPLRLLLAVLQLLPQHRLLIRPFEVINILAGRSRELHCESSKFKGPEQ